MVGDRFLDSALHDVEVLWIFRRVFRGVLRRLFRQVPELHNSNQPRLIRVKKPPLADAGGGFIGSATRKSGATWRPIQDQQSRIGVVDVVFPTFDAEEFIVEMAEEKGGRMRPPVFNSGYFINP